jgi:hypothetical protein
VVVQLAGYLHSFWFWFFSSFAQSGGCMQQALHLQLLDIIHMLL